MLDGKLRLSVTPVLSADGRHVDIRCDGSYRGAKLKAYEVVMPLGGVLLWWSQPVKGLYYYVLLSIREVD